ncbi:MAG: DNA adenine methylase [Methanophagales archaeon]|nr:DNA adenine methylase [Methanophagales archaeon]
MIERASQLTLMGDLITPYKLPTTRYQGSKSKIVEWIWEAVKKINFKSVLDAFGGTGIVGYFLKMKGKRVFYNDILKSNYYIGTALIENDAERLSKSDIDFLLQPNPDINYPTFIQDTFSDIYYTDDENRWLDMVIQNIENLDSFYKRTLAYYALFQSCIIKRPYNLFHRKNLYMRTSNVKRSFGNKATWDTPFEEHFLNFVNEANGCVFSNGKKNKALNLDVFDIEGDFDLVYIDTPYISREGVGVDYMEFYHFLEGIVNYQKWKDMIDYRSKHRRIKHNKPVWCDKNKIYTAFNKLFEKFQDASIVVSYRSDGIPSIESLKRILKRYKPVVREVRYGDYKYVLSNNSSEECLLLGLDESES